MYYNSVTGELGVDMTLLEFVYNTELSDWAKIYLKLFL